MMKIIKILFIPLVLILGFSGCGTDQTTGNGAPGHVIDQAGIISTSDLPRFEWMLDLIEKESDLDIKFLFLQTIGNATIEEVAVEKMDEFARAFDSLLVNIRGYYRFADGDNRELPVKIDVQEES